MTGIFSFLHFGSFERRKGKRQVINKDKLEKFTIGQMVVYENEQGQEIKGFIKRLNKDTATVMFKHQQMRRIDYLSLKNPYKTL